MRHYYLEKTSMGKFIESLKEGYRVVAPIKKENQFVFAKVESAGEVELEYLPTVLPPKKYLFPQKEKLGTFDMGDTKLTDTSVEVEPMIIFAAHTCDIEGLECLDVVFNSDPADPYYKARKKSLLIIGFECMVPCDEYATCRTMDTHNPKAGYDVMITDVGSKYVLHVNSKEGKDLLEGNSALLDAGNGEAKTLLAKTREEKLKRFDNKLKPEFSRLARLFGDSYTSPVWDEVGEKCLSCGNCTAVCPTCYCLDMYDKVKLDTTGGERKRVWDSCQLEEFASVAGGENFREERSSRQRHRYYRKFDYSVKKYHKFFCTGCGRCSRTCMAGISLIETVNSLDEENENV